MFYKKKQANPHLLERMPYLKLRLHRLRQMISTSFKFADKERFKYNKWKQCAIGGMRTFLIFGHPTQVRFCSRRLGCSLDRWAFSCELVPDEMFSAGNSVICPLLQPQFKSCIFTQPFRLTCVRCVQQARSSSMAH